MKNHLNTSQNPAFYLNFEFKIYLANLGYFIYIAKMSLYRIIQDFESVSTQFAGSLPKSKSFQIVISDQISFEADNVSNFYNGEIDTSFILLIYYW